jgi:sulfide:quinone oxidoreductase
LLRDLEEGYTKSVAFVVPPSNTWPLPAYELALMTAYDARGMGIADVEITIYTPEAAPLANFGAAAGEGIRSDLDEAGVAIETGAYVSEVDGRLTLLPDGATLEAQRTVALPMAAGPRVEGLPSDRLGFVLTDQHGRVPHASDVWAAGDAIAFPVKQGGLAAQQAEPFRPVLRGVVLTGRGQRWLRHDPAQDPEGATARHALFWPPTKVAGRYLSPFLAELDQAEQLGDQLPQPDGRPVELDLEREIPAAADALRLARSRGG